MTFINETQSLLTWTSTSIHDKFIISIIYQTCLQPRPKAKEKTQFICPGEEREMRKNQQNVDE